MMNKPKVRAIAINLPQFHPFKENDEWWGKGFTEWTNVTKAKPRFKGHYQPHLPTDTGFYDLRLPESRKMQADMAREAGIYGFCYYHYWFNGHQLMERPVNEILASGEPDFPFMLCWANENWARNWDGGCKDVLMEQCYSEEDDVEHMRWLCENVFLDKRYIRVDGKPVFAVYKKNLFPNFKKTIAIWRRIAKDEYGIELYLMYADFPDSNYGEDPLMYGVDASFDFQPIAICNDFLPLHNHIKQFVNKWSWRIPILRSRKWFRDYIDNIPDLYSYADYVEYRRQRPMTNLKRFPCVSPGFDNSPRRVGKKFICMIGNTPELFGLWLRDVITRFVPFSRNEDFIFINAWNEWAEGNIIEPDNQWGRERLSVIKELLVK